MLRAYLTIVSLTWDVHVRAVDVVSRGEVPSVLAVDARSLLARPRLVPPREEH